MKNFWLVDFNQNERLLQNIEEFPKPLFKEEILEEMKKHTGNFYAENLKNRLIINNANNSKYFTSGSIKIGQGLIWIMAYEVIKDFELTKDYEKIYLRDHIQTYTKAIPLDLIIGKQCK